MRAIRPKLRTHAREHIVTIDTDSAPRIMFYGENLMMEDLPVGTRVIYPKRPMTAVAASLTLVAIIGKLVSGWGVLDRRVNRWVVGVGMVPRGEVGLIFAGVGLGAHIITDGQYGAILIVVALTTFFSPVFLKRLLHEKKRGV